MGLFGSIGRSLRDGSLQDGFASSQAILAGDYGSALQIRQQRARQEAAQAESQREQQAEEAQLQAAAAALTGRNVSKAEIMAMRPEDRSALIRSYRDPRQFGPGGGSIVTPGGPGEQPGVFVAPSRHEYRGSVFDVGSDGAVNTHQEGVEYVITPPGGRADAIGTMTGRPLSQDEVMSPPPRRGIIPRPGQGVIPPAMVEPQAPPEVLTDEDIMRLESQGGAGRSGPQTFPRPAGNFGTPGFNPYATGWPIR